MRRRRSSAVADRSYRNPRLRLRQTDRSQPGHAISGRANRRGKGPSCARAGRMSLQQLRRAACRLGRARPHRAAASARDKWPLSRRRFATWRSRILGRQAGCASLEAERLSFAETSHSCSRRLGAHSSLPDATAVRHEEGTAIPLALLFRSAARNRFRQSAPFQVPSCRSCM